jgi:hypothetical protein
MRDRYQAAPDTDEIADLEALRRKKRPLTEAENEVESNPLQKHNRFRPLKANR